MNGGYLNFGQAPQMIGQGQQQQTDPFALYAYMQQQKAQQGQPDGRQQVSDQLAQQIMGQSAQSVPQGASQLATGIGMGLQKYNNSQFPAAPGGAQPDLATRFGNLFSFGHNGGLS